MSSFSPTDAAFSVFPLLGRYPRFVGLVVALSVPIGLITSVLIDMGMGEAITALNAAAASGNPIPPEELAAIGALVNLPMTLLMVVFSLIANAMLTGVMLRKTVLNQDPIGLGLGFGSLELRLIQANLVLFVGFMLAGTLVATLAGLLAALMGGGLGSAMMSATLIPVAISMLVVLAIGRLGLFGVAAAATGTNGLKAAWDISRTRFWSIVGALLLWYVALLVMLLVVQTVVSLALGVGADTAGLLGSPQAIIASALMAGFGGFLQLGTICVGAYAWHQIQANAPQPGIGPV